MPYGNLKKLFVSWLKENAHRFEHVPVPVDSVKKRFCFEGIIPNITLTMSYDALEATLFFDERSPCKYCSPWDLCDIAYIGCGHYDKEKGYYDTDREDGNYTYFPTQAELYTNEVFEQIIEYTNKNLIEESYLYLYKSKGGGWQDSFIASKDVNHINHKFLREILQTYREVDASVMAQDGFDRDDYIEIHTYDLFDEDEYSVRFFEESVN